MKYIECAGLAARRDHGGRLDRLRTQQPHDVGDVAGPQLREKRHLGDHPPGAHEVAPVDRSWKRVRDDADRHATMTNPRKWSRRDQLADRRHRDHVAIPMVPSVTIAQRMASGIVPRVSGWTWRRQGTSARR